MLEEGFPKIDSIFPKAERTKLKAEIIEKLGAQDTEDRDFTLQTRRYLSKFSNQHTSIYLPFQSENIYPFVAIIFKSEWRLFNISKEFDSLYIGKGISTVNGINTEMLENRLVKYTFSENRVNQQNELNNLQLYNKSEFLLDAEVIKNTSDQLTIGFEDGSSVVLTAKEKGEDIDVYEVMQKPNPITKKQSTTYDYQVFADQNFAYLQFNNMHDKADVLDGIESYVKPWIQPVARGSVKRQFKKESPSKRIALYYNPKHPVFAEFIKELVDNLNNNKVENSVIDLRYNNGGNLLLGKQLMYYLTDKASVSISSSYLVHPLPFNGIYQIPQYTVDYTMSDIVEGQDPHLEKVLELIRMKN